MTEREALKLALEALKRLDGWLALRYGSGLTPEEKQTVTAIKEALAQTEQKPVVWMYQNKSTHEVRFQKHMRSFVDHSAWYEIPLYSEPLANQEKTSGSPIKEALAQPEHGWTPERIAGMARLKDAQDKKLAQRTWVGLTDEEVNTIYEQAEVLVHDSWVGNGTVGLMFPITLYKMFEAKLKEKNT